MSSLPSWLIPMAGFWSLQLLSKASSGAGYHTAPLVLRPQVLNFPTAAPPSPVASPNPIPTSAYVLITNFFTAGLFKGQPLLGAPPLTQKSPPLDPLTASEAACTSGRQAG